MAIKPIAIGTATGGNTDVSVEDSNGSLLFRPNGSERIRIESSGNVGIGTSSPQKALEVLNGEAHSRYRSTVLQNAQTLQRIFKIAGAGVGIYASKIIYMKGIIRANDYRGSQAVVELQARYNTDTNGGLNGVWVVDVFTNDFIPNGRSGNTANMRLATEIDGADLYILGSRDAGGPNRYHDFLGLVVANGCELLTVVT